MITTLKLKNYMENGYDNHKVATWIINTEISKHMPLSLDDLSDNAVVLDEITAIVECLEQKDYQDALNIGYEAAYNILEDQGFEVS